MVDLDLIKKLNTEWDFWFSFKRV